MMKYIILFSMLFAVYYCENSERTDTVFNLKCGTNRETKTNDIVMYSFNEHIEEGEIEFSGHVYEMTEVYVFLTRGNGEKSDLRKDNSLFIRANKPENYTRFDSKNMDGSWYREFSIDGNSFKPNDENKLKITILTDRFEIYSNGQHRWTASRIGDEGQKIGAAVVVGPFNPEKVILICKSTVPLAIRTERKEETEEEKDDDEE